MNLPELILIPGFEKYAIKTRSTKIVNLNTGKELKPVSDSSDAVKYKLSKNGKTKTLTLFQIIRSALRQFQESNRNLAS